MDKDAIKTTIAILSENKISPYDLLLAIGKDDVVPDEVIQSRKARVINRDGKENPAGYVINAIEDLKKLSFKGKDKVLDILHKAINKANNNALGQFDFKGDPKDQAQRLLHLVFIVTPLLAGADKFFNWSTDWGKYLSPTIENLSPLPKKKLMHLIGVIEMVAGIVTALNPQLGGYIVSAWLGAIAVNLVSLGENYDIVLRDLGLGLSALALARLSQGPVTKITT